MHHKTHAKTPGRRMLLAAVSTGALLAACNNDVVGANQQDGAAGDGGKHPQRDAGSHIDGPLGTPVSVDAGADADAAFFVSMGTPIAIDAGADSDAAFFVSMGTPIAIDAGADAASTTDGGPGVSLGSSIALDAGADGEH